MQIEIKDYLEFIKLSNSQRPKPYKGKVINKIKLPKSIQAIINEGNTTWFFNSKKSRYELKTLNGEFVVANKNQVGKPKIVKINGQGLWSGTIAMHVRNAYKDQMTEFYKPFIDLYANEINLLKKPVKLRFEFFYDGKQDIDNHSIIHIKVLLDVIKQHLGDDSLEYIQGYEVTGYKSTERKLIITI